MNKILKTYLDTAIIYRKEILQDKEKSIEHLFGKNGDIGFHDFHVLKTISIYPRDGRYDASSFSIDYSKTSLYLKKIDFYSEITQQYREVKIGEKITNENLINKIESILTRATKQMIAEINETLHFKNNFEAVQRHMLSALDK